MTRLEAENQHLRRRMRERELEFWGFAENAYACPQRKAASRSPRGDPPAVRRSLRRSLALAEEDSA